MEATMRGRIILFIILAVAAVLAAAYLGASAGAPKAASKPPAPTASSPPEPTHDRTPGPGPARSPAAPSQQTRQKTGPPAAPPPAPTPKAPTPKACSLMAAAQPPAVTILSDPPPPSATDPLHFGQVSATSFDDTPLLSVAPQYDALATTFSQMEIKTGNGPGECDVTRSLSMTLPVTGTAQAGKLHFFTQGYAYTEQGTSAQVTLRANGQAKVQRFPAGFDDSYVAWLEFPVTPGATYTLSVQLEVHQKPGTGGTAYFNMLSTEGEFTATTASSPAEPTHDRTPADTPPADTPPADTPPAPTPPADTPPAPTPPAPTPAA
jgi:hypothetical protein